MTEIINPPPLEVGATIHGGLDGSVSGTVSLGPLPADRPPPKSKDLVERLVELVEKLIDCQEWIEPVLKWLSFLFKSITSKWRRRRMVGAAGFEPATPAV